MGERWDEFEMEEIRNRRMADLRKQVGQLTAKAAQLEQRAKVLETRVTALEHVVADLLERLRALEHGQEEEGESEEDSPEDLRVLCAWCGRHLSGPLTAPAERTTHGICPACQHTLEMDAIAGEYFMQRGQK